MFLCFYIPLCLMMKSSKNVHFILNFGTFGFADYNSLKSEIRFIKNIVQKTDLKIYQYLWNRIDIL
ncbi:conserved hypothetical protein [Capnocytophaga canimorsus]|uniref:Uncharacterized protein n=1 Tax=Capnocytophaga canimorsus TaxID=28188 RepID=A0A0B7IGD2_9FLAO|nr:conserved hypothetical protein [Capnocytophaga canimorsus]